MLIMKIYNPGGNTIWITVCEENREEFLVQMGKLPYSDNTQSSQEHRVKIEQDCHLPLEFRFAWSIAKYYSAK